MYLEIRMMKRTLLLSFGALAMGCSEYEVKNTTNANNDLSGDGEPDIVVAPAAIAFPSLNAADGLSATEVVIVTNQGTADLHINELYLDDDTKPFQIGMISSPLIPPSGQAQFSVTFAPDTAANNTGTVYIDSDDPDSPTVQVTLSGLGVAPIIEITPSDYDFGTLYIGCNSEQALTITNIGTDDLVISNFNFSTASTDLTFDAMEATHGPLPWTIPQQQSMEVMVGYAPYDEISDQAFLTVTSNDPYTPDVLVTQNGLGDIFAEYEDMFEQPIKGMTDIILGVDRSCSMDDDIANVQSNFGSFVETLSNMDADYHVAATAGEDGGCINGSNLYIDNTMSPSDAISAITEMINMTGSGGGGGCPEECAFMQFELALDQALSSGGCNSGLIREDAKLALVGVSDEPEQSTNDWSYYVSLFQSLKSNPDDVIIHAVGGDYPGGCGGNDAYTGMYEATMATGGLFLSICATDWGAHLEALAEGSAADLSSFPLTDNPVPETIIVKINGITTTVGWTYNSSINAVDFDQDYIPEGGSTIEVDYAVYGNCEQ